MVANCLHISASNCGAPCRKARLSPLPSHQRASGRVTISRGKAVHCHWQHLRFPNRRAGRIRRACNTLDDYCGALRDLPDRNSVPRAPHLCRNRIGSALLAKTGLKKPARGGLVIFDRHPNLLGKPDCPGLDRRQVAWRDHPDWGSLLFGRMDQFDGGGGFTPGISEFVKISTVFVGLM